MPGNDVNHTDAIQLYCGGDCDTGTVGSTVRGNLLVNTNQGMGGWDGVAPSTITHNVIIQEGVTGGDAWDGMWAWLYLYGDSTGSTVRWNSLLENAPGDYNAHSRIDCASKSGFSASRTTLQNNVSYSIALGGNGDVACRPTANDHNLLYETGVQPSFVGGSMALSQVKSYAGACLAPGSVGVTSATDGGQVGICGGDYNAQSDGPPEVYPAP